MRRLNILISFIFLLITISIKSYSFEIIFPSDNITIASSDVHIVARFENPSEVSVMTESCLFKGVLIPSNDTNGERFYMLMNVLKLREGLNKFKVIQGKQEKEIKIVKIVSPLVMEDWAQGLTNFHATEDKTKICITCHKFQSIRDCVNCHKDRLLGKWVHQPVKNGECFICHDRTAYFKIKEPSADICLNCHKELKMHIDKSYYIHGPVAAGYCTICHSPHKNNVQTHLRKSTQELCNQCHKSELLGYSYHISDYIKHHPVANRGSRSQIRF